MAIKHVLAEYEARVTNLKWVYIAPIILKMRVFYQPEF